MYVIKLVMPLLTDIFCLLKVMFDIEYSEISLLKIFYDKFQLY